MARPNKQGCEYFPLDVHLDDKFKFVEIKYGLEGFALLIKLMQKIYSYGYWYKWTDDEALLFADETRTDFEKVNNVVNESLKRGIFDNKMYESYNILTSKGIQKRYKEIVRRRKDVEVKEEYLLIDNNFGVNDDINPSPSKHNDDKSTQSKEKVKETESKKEIKSDIDNKISDLFNHYNSLNIINHKQLNSEMIKNAKKAMKEFSSDEIKQAMTNYATVYKSDHHWFDTKYTFSEVLRIKDIEKFIDESVPLEKFKRSLIYNKNKIRTPSETDKLAQFENLSFGK